MLRFSNGLKIHGGTGMDGKGFFVFEGSNLSIETHNKHWHLEIGNNPQRIWWRNTPGELLTLGSRLYSVSANLVCRAVCSCSLA